MKCKDFNIDFISPPNFIFFHFNIKHQQEANKTDPNWKEKKPRIEMASHRI